MSIKVSHRRQSLLTGSLMTSDISGKGPVCQCRRCKRLGFEPWVGKIPREGHGNPFQFFCLENPMVTRTWWATVHRVTKSWT